MTLMQAAILHEQLSMFHAEQAEAAETAIARAHHESLAGKLLDEAERLRSHIAVNEQGAP